MTTDQNPQPTTTDRDVDDLATACESPIPADAGSGAEKIEGGVLYFTLIESRKLKQTSYIQATK